VHQKIFILDIFPAPGPGKYLFFIPKIRLPMLGNDQIIFLTSFGCFLVFCLPLNPAGFQYKRVG